MLNMGASRRFVRPRRVGLRRLLLAFGLIVMVLGVAACSGSELRTDRPRDTADSSRRTASPSTPGPGTSSVDSETNSRSTEDAMNIQISIEGQRFRGTLSDSAAARDLLAQLPVIINMRDHGSVEKTGRLRSPLSLEGQPEGADPDVGDVGYYAPGNDFVLYYGDQSYFPGIVILGRLEGDAAARIAELDGSVTAVV